MKKEWLGYILLPAGIVGVLGGLSTASAGQPIGWLGIVVGIMFALLAYRLMTPPRTEPSSES